MSRKKPKRPVVLAMCGDPHMGSPVGILPPQGFELDEGNRILQSKAQAWLWDEVWVPYWAWVGKTAATFDADLYGVMNGDAMDAHPLARTLAAGDPESLAFIAEESFAPVLALPFKRFYGVRGTPSHVGGEAAGLEEMMYRVLKQRGLPVHRFGNQWTTWELALRFYGQTVQIAHHGRAGSKLHTMQSNATGWAVDIANRYRASGLEPPTLCVRSHVHTFADSGLSLINPTRFVTAPPMCLKNAYAHKVSAQQPSELSLVGGLAAVFFPEGHYTLRAFLRRPEAAEPAVVVA